MTDTRVKSSLADIAEREHSVQFFDDEDLFLKNLGSFIGAGLSNGESCVMIATPEHSQALRTFLTREGFDLDIITAEKRYIALDAEETLARFMDGNLPNQQKFQRVIGGVLQEAAGSHGIIRAFGEMVALLWARGYEAGAILLEHYWNEIAREYSFTLFCAYPIRYFEANGRLNMLRELSRLHSCAISPAPFGQARF